VGPVKTLIPGALAAFALALAACGGDDGGGDTAVADVASTSTSTTDGGACGEIEEVDVELSGQHRDTEFTVADYPTNPPTGGDHNSTPLAAGRFYTDPARLGEAVHLLEHGAVIGWTNGLSTADQKRVEDAFNAVFKDGYYQVAVVENPDLDVPFALSAWGAMQACQEVDVSVIRPFVEEWYASPRTAEGGLACQGDARTLANC